jgi:hypothetical protein
MSPPVVIGLVNGEDQVIGEEPPPADVSTCPLEPAVVGRLKLYVPAAACVAIIVAGPAPTPVTRPVVEFTVTLLGSLLV